MFLYALVEGGNAHPWNSAIIISVITAQFILKSSIFLIFLFFFISSSSLFRGFWQFFSSHGRGIVPRMRFFQFVC